MTVSESDPAVKQPGVFDVPGPKANFIMGNLTQFKLEKMHDFLEQTANDHGPIAKVKFGPKSAIVLSDPNTVQTVLKQRPEKFRRFSVIEQVLSEMGVKGVFSTEGEQWKRHRELIMPAFKPAQIKAFYPLLSNIAGHLNSAIANEQSHPNNKNAIDIQAIFKNYTTDITTKLAFGVDTHCLDNQESDLRESLNKIFPMVNARLKSAFPYWRFFKLPKDRVLDKAVLTVKNHLNGYIQNAKQNLQGNAEPGNILESMIVATNDKGDKFSESELFGNALTVLLAGEDTTANTLAWTIHYLASHPDIQEAIYQEIQASSNSSAPDFDDLDNFPLTFASAQEAIRLKPVAPFLYMENIKDEVIEGHLLPAGTLINHESKNDELFKQPEAFDPQRWLNLSTEDKRVYNKMLMPFGAGARLCPGRLLSFIEMKVALISLLKDYHFTHHDEDVQVDDSFEFTLVPKHLKVNAFKR